MRLLLRWRKCWRRKYVGIHSVNVSYWCFDGSRSRRLEAQFSRDVGRNTIIGTHPSSRAAIRAAYRRRQGGSRLGRGRLILFTTFQLVLHCVREINFHRRSCFKLRHLLVGCAVLAFITANSSSSPALFMELFNCQSYHAD